MSHTVKELVTARVNLVKKPKEGSNLLGFATINLLDGQFAVENVRVVKNSEGHPFVAMPGRKKMKDGKDVISEKTGKPEYDDIAHANTAEFRSLIHTAVLNAYAAAVAQSKANEAAGSK
jgi:DNA-binding cell septation regulator SpoVG